MTVAGPPAMVDIDHGKHGWGANAGWGADPPTVPMLPTRPSRSPMAAALLNLTGLGLGYAYLGRWWRTALFATGTVLLVVLAFVTDAAGWPWPWRVLAVVWAGWMVFDGWRPARRTHPRPLTIRGRVVPAAGGVLLVAAVVAGYLFYGAAGRQVYADGLAAEARADCPTAIMKYDTVTGPYELTLSRDVLAAKAKREQCVVFAAANSLFTEGRFCDALPVLDYFVTLPDAETAGVVGVANADRPQAMLECGLAGYREAAYPAAVTQLEALVGAYPDGPQAAQARSAIIAAKVSAELGGPPLPLPAPLGDNFPGTNPVTFYNASDAEDQVLLAGPTAHEFTLPGCPECPVRSAGHPARVPRDCRRSRSGSVPASTSGSAPARTCRC